MAFILGSAISASLVRLSCPHCHEDQVRARSRRETRYRCKKCNRPFSREEGEAEAARKIKQG